MPSGADLGWRYNMILLKPLYPECRLATITSEKQKRVSRGNLAIIPTDKRNTAEMKKETH